MSLDHMSPGSGRGGGHAREEIKGVGGAANVVSFDDFVFFFFVTLRRSIMTWEVYFN